MSKKDFIKLLVVAIIFQIPALIIILVRGKERIDITALVLGDYLVDTMYFFLLSPVLMILFTQFLSIFLAILLFKLHKSIKFNKYEYFIFKPEEIKLNFRELSLRAYILGIFAISIGTILTTYIPDLIIIPEKKSVAQYSFYILIAALLVLPYLTLILLPIWLLKDSGIKFSCKNYKEGVMQKLSDVKSVYHIYNSIVLGFIGLCATFAIFYILLNEATLLIETDDESFIILSLFVPFLTIFVFFATSGVSIIPIMIYSLQVKKLKEKFVKKLTSQGLKIVNSTDII